MGRLAFPLLLPLNHQGGEEEMDLSVELECFLPLPARFAGIVISPQFESVGLLCGPGFGNRIELT